MLTHFALPTATICPFYYCKTRDTNVAKTGQFPGKIQLTVLETSRISSTIMVLHGININNSARTIQRVIQKTDTVPAPFQAAINIVLRLAFDMFFL